MNKLSAKKIRYGAFIAVAIAAVIVAYVRLQGSPLPGQKIPVTLTDYAGKSVSFDQYVGGFSQKPLIVYFWATWCPYCSAEFAHLAEVEAQYNGRIQILAIDRGEPLAVAKGYTDALNLPGGLVYLIDSNDALFKQLGGYAMPETLFINGAGKTVLQQHGPITNDAIDAAAKEIAQ